MSFFCVAGLVIWAMADFIFPAGDEFREPPTFHDEMEKRLKMDF